MFLRFPISISTRPIEFHSTLHLCAHSVAANTATHLSSHLRDAKNSSSIPYKFLDLAHLLRLQYGGQQQRSAGHSTRPNGPTRNLDCRFDSSGNNGGLLGPPSTSAETAGFTEIALYPDGRWELVMIELPLLRMFITNSHAYQTLFRLSFDEFQEVFIKSRCARWLDS